MSQLTNYVDTLMDLAQQQGLSASNDIAYKLKSDVIVILSFTEPLTHTFPLNGLWIIANGSSANYKKVMRRTSKTATSPYQNTWVEETDYNTVMNTVQTWDPNDLPAPTIISASGGRVSGKVLVRTGATTFDSDELVPRSYPDALRVSMNNSFFTMFNNMNQRVNSNLSSIRELQTELPLLASRVEVLEEGAAQKMRMQVFMQEQPSTVWSLNHGLGQGSGIPFVTDEVGEILWPETVNPAEGNPDVLLLTFLEPVSGVAQLLYMPIAQE